MTRSIVKVSTTFSKAFSGLGRWLGAGLTMAVMAYGGYAGWQELAPFGIEMPELDGNTATDPRTPIEVEGVGLGTRLSEVELRDESGKLLKGKLSDSEFKHDTPLAFGTRYTLKASVERPWLGQRETRQISFATVAIPKLDGPEQRALAPDASLALNFDRPVGQLETEGDLPFTIEPATNHRDFRLIARNYAQNKTYAVELRLKTATGVPVPPVHLQISTPPPLTAEISNHGQSNLGLAIPLRITFGELLANKDEVGKFVSVHTKDGKAIPGKWQWLNKHKLQFSPNGGWPASSAIEASLDPKGPKSVLGGVLEKPLVSHFTTGADKKILVYLDTQRALAIENGQVVKTFAVSTGKPNTPTVTGSFYIYARFPTKTMRSRAKPGEKGHYVVEDVPYAQYFYEDYAFHGAWWHNGFGHPASHGCVNMATRRNNKRWPNSSEDAGWLYQWAALGVPVSVMPHAPAQTQVAANETSAPTPAAKPAARSQ